MRKGPFHRQSRSNAWGLRAVDAKHPTNAVHGLRDSQSISERSHHHHVLVLLLNLKALVAESGLKVLYRWGLVRDGTRRLLRHQNELYSVFVNGKH